MSEPVAAAAPRERVLDFVARFPGVHVREVERQLGLSSRLAAYHLEALEEEGRVASVRERGYTRFLPATVLKRLPERDVAFLCLMRRAPALRIALLLLAEGERTQGDIAKRLDIAKPSASYHLAMLVDAGFATVRRDGRERRYALADAARARRLLEAYPPVPGDVDAFSAMWDDLFA